MRRLDTRLDGPILLAPDVFGDERGFFCETYRRSTFMELGIHEEMVQDNHSRSRRGVVRGMHFSVGRGAAKLVRCGRGAIHDVLVDVRRGSPTFGQWEGFDLTDENMHLLYVPVGFAHGFCVLSDTADVLYKQDAYYERRHRPRHSSTTIPTSRSPGRCRPTSSSPPSATSTRRCSGTWRTACRSNTAERARADQRGVAAAAGAQDEQRHVVALLAALEGLQRLVDARGHLVGVERRRAVEQLAQPLLAEAARRPRRACR